jgi:hypothetical protein
MDYEDVGRKNKMAEKNKILENNKIVLKEIWCKKINWIHPTQTRARDGIIYQR